MVVRGAAVLGAALQGGHAGVLGAALALRALRAFGALARAAAGAVAALDDRPDTPQLTWQRGLEVGEALGRLATAIPQRWRDLTGRSLLEDGDGRILTAIHDCAREMLVAAQPEANPPAPEARAALRAGAAAARWACAAVSARAGVEVAFGGVAAAEMRLLLEGYCEGLERMRRLAALTEDHPETRR